LIASVTASIMESSDLLFKPIPGRIVPSAPSTTASGSGATPPFTSPSTDGVVSLLRERRRTVLTAVVSAASASTSLPLSTNQLRSRFPQDQVCGYSDELLRGVCLRCRGIAFVDCVVLLFRCAAVLRWRHFACKSELYSRCVAYIEPYNT
jgi:hypothetical protein